ncbi:MAG: cation:proton antiporter [Solobacterium sp.]|nr:cation:proton antiporter [Solobacterium sp.]
MIFSAALIILFGLLTGALCQKAKLPPLIGMLGSGILLGPYGLGWLDDSILGISADLRKIALILILLRAGLNLNIEDLKRAGRPAVLMSFLPATFEIAGTTLLGGPLLGMSLKEALVLGSVLGAVSPAVIVPHMLKLMDEGYGRDKAIPQMILAGASADDIYVIVLFSCFTAFAQGQGISPLSFLRIPTSIGLGIGVGVLSGILVSRILIHVKDGSKRTLILLCASFLLVSLDDQLQGVIGCSGLLGSMAMGLTVSRLTEKEGHETALQLGNLWKGAELFLFVLVGAAVNIRSAVTSGLRILLLISGALLFRMVGVYLCLLKTKLNRRETWFCMFAYLPKATVQAAIGAVPLSMGLSCGTVVLSTAVIAILITAPLGALLIDLTYPRWLTKTPLTIS